MTPSKSDSPVFQWLLRKVANSIGELPVRFHLWNGYSISTASGDCAVEVEIRDMRALLDLVLNPEYQFGRLYSDGRVEVRGDLVALLESVSRARLRLLRVGPSSRLYAWWTYLLQRNSRSGSRKNIHRHYDIQGSFYQLWLDRNLLYTCAYYPSHLATLEEAQIAKMDYVCRKTRLQAGERVVEAGCGWGALAIFMARHYGVEVKAYNISHEQIAWARKRAKEEGLDDRVEFIEDDYRNIRGSFDAFISVGMLEHVGASHYLDLGRVIDRSLKETGRGLLHFIGRNRSLPLNSWIRRRIFPGAYPPTIREAMQIFEPCGFSVLDIENIRLHYAKTLESWLQRYELSRARVQEMFGPQFVRAWRIYLAGSLAAFRTGWLQLFQVVFARQGNNAIPWTREHLYVGTGQDEEQRWMSVMS